MDKKLLLGVLTIIALLTIYVVTMIFAASYYQPLGYYTPQAENTGTANFYEFGFLVKANGGDDETLYLRLVTTGEILAEAKITEGKTVFQFQLAQPLGRGEKLTMAICRYTCLWSSWQNPQPTITPYLEVVGNLQNSKK